MIERIKIVEKHRDSMRTEYRGEYGYIWTESEAFDGPISSFQAAFTLLEQQFPHTFLAPRYLDMDQKCFIIQVVAKDERASDLGTYQVSAGGQVTKIEG